MKYCRTCKLRAADAATMCPQCGQPLATLGGAPAGGAAGGPSGRTPVGSDMPQLSLQGQIRALEAVRSRNVHRTRILALIAGAVFVALLVTAYEVYAHAVLSYAVLRDVKIEQDDSSENLFRVSFDVATTGKVAYDRRSGGQRTEKIDEFSTKGRQELSWAWPSDARTGVDFRVVYRDGLFRTSADRHFGISGRGPRGVVDVVFLLDTTASMNHVIKGLKERCIEFADIVRDKGHDCRLGLIGFGDVEIEEPIYVFPPSPKIQEFQTAVAEIPRTQGGDDPESSVEALRRALKLQFRKQATVCFVHITDESCHHRQELLAVADEMQSRKIIGYVVSKEEQSKLYAPLCVNGGRFYAIESARFDDILLNVARSLSNQIGYK